MHLTVSEEKMFEFFFFKILRNLNVCNFSGKIADFHFSHYKSMENLSCHSNHSSYPPGIKNTNYVEATVRNMYTKYKLDPLDSF